MKLEDVVRSLNNLEVYEKRSGEQKYYELVFYTRDLKKWVDILSTFFGKPVKPAGMKPEKDHMDVTKNFGWIFDNQILFKATEDKTIRIAMLWPWEDGEHITLKLAEI